jgi:hypothetical protein
MCEFQNRINGMKALFLKTAARSDDVSVGGRNSCRRGIIIIKRRTPCILSAAHQLCCYAYYRRRRSACVSVSLTALSVTSKSEPRAGPPHYEISCRHSPASRSPHVLNKMLCLFPSHDGVTAWQGCLEKELGSKIEW